jgi:beta-N-acetylhexosaminidase
VPLERLLGQLLMGRVTGTAASPALLARVRRGELGGVILFGDNVERANVPALVGKLQAAARTGRQLPLLIATDQEGGIVKRLPGPPTEPPAAMMTTAAAREQGLATGRCLNGLGIDADLAPVLDVPTSRSSFIYPPAFSTSPSLVASRGVSFADGLTAAGVVATAKHFPGLDRLSVSTDSSAETVHASRTTLARDLIPFRHAIAAGVPAIMVGTAGYPAYGDTWPAALSPSIVTKLLRDTLHFRGVTLSDALDTAAVSGRLPLPQATVQAVRAGIDMAYIGAADEATFAALLRAANDGTLPRPELEASCARVAALKSRFATGSGSASHTFN